jgi:hypothetical protein
VLARLATLPGCDVSVTHPRGVQIIDLDSSNGHADVRCDLLGNASAFQSC